MTQGELVQSLCAECRNIPGAAAEVGVYRGKSAVWICKALPEKTVYLFDTFAGMPAADEIDGHKQGDFDKTSIEIVKDTLKDYENYRLTPGVFPASAKGIRQDWAFVHVDCDLYRSVKACCEWFWPTLNGIILFDDYGFPRCKGARKAVDEFVAREGLTLESDDKRVWIRKHRCH